MMKLTALRTPPGVHAPDMDALGAGVASEQGRATAAAATTPAARTGCRPTLAIDTLD